MPDQAKDRRDYLIAVNQENLARAIQWVSVVDSKALIVLTIVLAVTGFVISQAPRALELSSSMWNSKSYGLAILVGTLLLTAFLFLGASLIYLLLIIYPKRMPHTQEPSYFFYGSISTMASADFNKKMTSISVKEAARGLSDQTYNLAKVVTRKFDQLSMSIKFFSVGLLAFLVDLLFVAVLSYAFP